MKSPSLNVYCRGKQLGVKHYECLPVIWQAKHIFSVQHYTAIYGLSTSTDFFTLPHKCVI